MIWVFKNDWLTLYRFGESSEKDDAPALPLKVKLTPSTLKRELQTMSLHTSKEPRYSPAYDNTLHQHLWQA